MDADDKISERFDIRICFSTKMDIRIHIRFNMDTKWKYFYPFSIIFLYPIPHPHSKKCKISDIIHIPE
jgi:hypothetical protein